MKTPSNRLLISLSLADLMMMTKSWVLVINMWHNGPFLGLPGKDIHLCNTFVLTKSKKCNHLSTSSNLITLCHVVLCSGKNKVRHMTIKNGFAGCMTFATFGNMAGLAQIWTLTVIAYDRAMAIFYPLRREKRMRHSQVKQGSAPRYSRVQYTPSYTQVQQI
jgi:hypothetical protein